MLQYTITTTIILWSFIHDNMHEPAPPVRNRRILSVLSFTACMQLLMATSAFGLGRRCWSSPKQCHLHCLCTICLPTSRRSPREYIKHGYRIPARNRGLTLAVSRSRRSLCAVSVSRRRSCSREFCPARSRVSSWRSRHFSCTHHAAM